MKSLLCFFILSINIFLIGCKKGEISAQINNSKKTPDSVQSKIQEEENKTVTNDSQSFVLSCGSGCAMTYVSENITGNLPELKVKFKVEMYVDEKLSDTYNEVYIFSYDQSNQIEDVHLEGKNENVLKTLLPTAQISFRDFAKELVKKNSNKESSTALKIIYNKKNDPKTASYETIETSSVKGLEKYSCNEQKTRYISIPSKSDIKLFLIPQDCGDFQYRYYLIAIKDNKVTGNLYVDGEWYEPDNEEDKELRSFSIDSQYNILVKIQTADSSKSENYSIKDNGSFIKN
ncbi:hypothetical protein J3D55_001500 [Chryseobacterium ginsenosidimutans]|uniref:hypothetical protein n=1 Tax=Chryseobacterium ginsenosidimutans TaxID=687846 RepID=UPI00216817C2|nr:hypothetical protein [Chryseobacterium ginsenosidimutans]MCS3868584.1 hypothetical protein [Chryseobacterium ginsenosidimutans]